MVAGAAFLFDLRLLGCKKQIPVSSLAAYLLPWSKRGLLLVIPSGLLLFITNAGTLGTDITFWVKMTLLFLAGVNALFFESITFATVRVWNEKSSTPPAARFSAFVSIVLWLSIIACGRLLAY